MFDWDEVGGGSSETGCEVVVGETALTAGVKELTRWFSTGEVGVESPTWFLVRRDRVVVRRLGVAGVVAGVVGAVVGGAVGIVVASMGLSASKILEIRLLLLVMLVLLVLMDILVLLILLLVLLVLMLSTLWEHLSDRSRDLTRETLGLVLHFLAARACMVPASLTVVTSGQVATSQYTVFEVLIDFVPCYRTSFRGKAALVGNT